MDTLSYRHELKFLCEERQLYFMEYKIRHICRRDSHAGGAGVYSIKSLYFDTIDDNCYYENQDGVDDRKKYRIRIYNNDADVIKLECKYARRGMKAKEACQISRQQYDCLTGSTLPICGEQQGLTGRFLAERNMELLVPKVIVAYERTPYVFPAGNVRITFDRGIRSSYLVADFLKKDTAYRSILPENIHILEVKYDEVLPAAIQELLTAGQELRRTSFSKYALCREYGTR